jgi:hypothetical protein
MTLCFPTVPALNEYSCLLSTDPEVDFFNNIVHLQVSFLQHAAVYWLVDLFIQYWFW